LSLKSKEPAITYVADFSAALSFLCPYICGRKRGKMETVTQNFRKYLHIKVYVNACRTHILIILIVINLFWCIETNYAYLGQVIPVFYHEAVRNFTLKISLKKILGRPGGCMPIIPALGRLKQETCESEHSLGHIPSSWVA
jgi:hypothetical protein